MAKVIVEGHRGFCAEYPENTLLSYEKAMALGVDAIEFDVWLSKDKVPVLMHDGNVKRTCGGGDRHLRDLTFAEIRELDPCFRDRFGDRFAGQVKVPTLRELLESGAKNRPDLWYGVEIKEYTEETVDLTVAMLHEFGVFGRCWFYAFNGRIIRYLKERYNGRTMGYPEYQMGEFCGFEWYDEIGLSLAVARSDDFPRLKALGLPMHLFCADTDEDVRFCMDAGASLITANDPRPLMAALRG